MGKAILGFVWGVVRAGLFFVFARGFLLWLATKGIHPERRFAEMIGQAETVAANLSTAKLILAGVITVICLGLWKLFSWWWTNRAGLGLGAYVFTFTAIGAFASLILALALYAWKLPTKEVEIAKPVAGGEAKSDWLTYTFDLFSGGGELRLGKCPGPDCMIFRLAEIKREGDVAFQYFTLEGANVGGVRGGPGEILFEGRSMIWIHGNGHVGYDIENAVAHGHIALDLKSQIAVCSEKYDMVISIPHVDAQKLSLLLKIKGGTWTKGHPSKKCIWMQNFATEDPNVSGKILES